MNDKPFWTADSDDADYFKRIQDERLQKARDAIERMTAAAAAEGRRTVENTLAPYDEAMLHLDAAASQSELMQEVHPNAEFRAAAEKLSQKASALATEISLNRAVFDALSALDLDEADAETRYYVEKTLRDFRLAGVDKDEATREKIKALRDEIVLVGQEFARNIREDQSRVVVRDVAELEGLPEDFIANHPPDDEDGKIVLTTDYPDYLPVISYAKSEDLRRRMYLAYNNRAYPQNLSALKRLAEKRFELAHLLGFKNWADYVTADKMIGSAAKASDFISRVVEASGERAAREYRELLERKRKDAPDAAAVNRWESAYYTEIVSKENYSFDSQSVRLYFPYERVKQGVLDVMSRLFGVTFRRIENAPVWHEAVECWEMFEDGRRAGRFYLDMHPREGKYNHAAQFGIHTGVAGRQIPEAALVCNFPGGNPATGDPGLLEYDEVSTFFHEFGHLLHTLFAGRGRWAGLGGIRCEWDFVEAPSQLLEEWTKDAATLQTFARHFQTDEPIPTELVERMNRANEFGKGLRVRQQMAYARLSLSIYDRPPDELDTDDLVRSISAEYSPFPVVENTHMQTSFGHLDGYSAIYYTYMWSLVLAKDMFSRFDKNNLLEPGGAAARYRKAVLEPGGAKPAERLVEDFLGRKPNFDAWRKWLDEDLAPQQRAA
jgi:thimet oligopeptidase